MCKFGVGFMESITNQHDEDFIERWAPKSDRSHRSVVENASHDVVWFDSVIQMEFDAAFAAISSCSDTFDGRGEFRPSQGLDFQRSWVEGLSDAVHRIVEDFSTAIDEQNAVAQLFRLMQDMGGEDDGSPLRVQIGDDTVEQFGIDRIQSGEGLIKDQ